MANEMKLCPFCGGEADMVNDAPECWVRCMTCHASSDTVVGADRAIEIWNTRADSSRVEALTSALREARDAWADQLENDLEGCCPHNEDGSRDESQMDGLSRPFIEETRALVGRLDAAIAGQPTDAVARIQAEEAEIITYAMIAPKCFTGPTETLYENAIHRLIKDFPPGSELVPLVRQDGRVSAAHRERMEAERAVIEAAMRWHQSGSQELAVLHIAVLTLARLSLSDTPDGKVG